MAYIYLGSFESDHTPSAESTTREFIRESRLEGIAASATRWYDIDRGGGWRALFIRGTIDDAYIAFGLMKTACPSSSHSKRLQLAKI